MGPRDQMPTSCVLLMMQHIEKLDDSKKKRIQEIVTGARTAPAAGPSSSGVPESRQEVWEGFLPDYMPEFEPRPRLIAPSWPNSM